MLQHTHLLAAPETGRLATVPPCPCAHVRVCLLSLVAIAPTCVRPRGQPLARTILRVDPVTAWVVTHVAAFHAPFPPILNLIAHTPLPMLLPLLMMSL